MDHVARDPPAARAARRAARRLPHRRVRLDRIVEARGARAGSGVATARLHGRPGPRGGHVRARAVAAPRDVGRGSARRLRLPYRRAGVRREPGVGAIAPGALDCRRRSQRATARRPARLLDRARAARGAQGRGHRRRAGRLSGADRSRSRQSRIGGGGARSHRAAQRRRRPGDVQGDRRHQRGARDAGAGRGAGGVDGCRAADRQGPCGSRGRGRRPRAGRERPPARGRQSDARRPRCRHARPRRVASQPLRRHHVASKRRRPHLQRRRHAADGRRLWRSRVERRPSSRAPRAAGRSVGGVAPRAAFVLEDCLQRGGRSPGLRPRRDRSLRARRRLRAGHARCGRSGSARAPHPGARARARGRRRRCLRRARAGRTRHNVGAALEPREANHGSACRRAAAPGSASRSAEPVSGSRSRRRRVRCPRRCRIRIRDRGDGRAGSRVRCARRCVAGGSARAHGRRCRRGRGGARRPRRKISRRPRRRDEGSSHGVRGAGRGIVARGPPRGGAQGEPSARQRSRPWNRQQLSAGAARVGGGRRVGGGAGEARAGEADAIRSAGAPRDARRHERARVDRAGVADPLEHRWRAIPDHVGLRGRSRGGARHEPCASGESRRRRPARHDDVAPSSCTRSPACERLPRPRAGAGASRRRRSAVVEGHPGAVGGSRRERGRRTRVPGRRSARRSCRCRRKCAATPPSAAG